METLPLAACAYWAHTAEENGQYVCVMRLILAGQQPEIIMGGLGLNVH
jgi:hypothetical protein